MIKLRLKELMNDGNLTTNDIAKVVGMDDDSTIYAWSKGSRLPNLNNAIKLADYFSVSLDYLLSRTEDFSQTKFGNCPPFHEQFRKILKIKNVSQYQMCVKDKIISPGHIDLWLNKKYQPSLENIVKLADYFGVSVDFLVGRE